MAMAMRARLIRWRSGCDRSSALIRIQRWRRRVPLRRLMLSYPPFCPHEMCSNDGLRQSHLSHIVGCLLDLVIMSLVNAASEHQSTVLVHLTTATGTGSDPVGCADLRIRQALLVGT